MTTGLLVFHIILAAAMIGIILLQRNEGGGLGMNSSSMGGLMTTRGTANLLTRTTGVLAGCFFATTIILALLFKGAHNAKSILDNDDIVVIEQNVQAPIQNDSQKISENSVVPDVKISEDLIVNNTAINQSQSVSKDLTKGDGVPPKSNTVNKSVKIETTKNSVKK